MEKIELCIKTNQERFHVKKNIFKGILVDIKPIIDIKSGFNMGNVIYNTNSTFILCGISPESRDGEYRPLMLNLQQLDFDILDISVAENFCRHHPFITPLDDKTMSKFILKLIQYMPDFEMFKNYKLKTKPDTRSFNILVNKTGATGLTSFNYYDSVGCKIIPLTLYDIKNIENIKCAFRCEIVINNMISIFKSLCYCSHYSNLYGYFIAENCGTEIFNNSTIKKKYTDSKKHQTTLKNLIETQNNQSSGEYGEIVKNKLSLPIQFVEKNIILSRTSCILINKNMGPTIAETKLIWSEVNVKHIIFQLLYATYCLHIHGIIHGDMHLNNITIKQGTHDLSYLFESTCYSFSADYKIYIIDFGRVILGNKFSMTNIEDKKDLRKTHVSKLLNYVSKSVPELFAEKRGAIEKLIKSDFHIAMKTFACLDIIMFIRNFKLEGSKQLNDESLCLLSDIESDCMNFIRKNIEKTADELVNEILIQKYFREFVSTTVHNNINYFRNIEKELITVKIDESQPILEKIKQSEMARFKKIGILN